ncbi:MAG: diguanylate cyclase/phosphodiesterase, partial [Solirubrobacterales bacterium]|nr:diguanylate cyclase/phosphodiesterase [Solirubrobacterales bacterium]
MADALAMAASRRLVPTRVFPIFLAYLGAYGAWQIFRWGGADSRPVIGDLSFVPLIGAAVALAWRAGARCDAQPRLRSGWRLIALGLFAYFLGNVVQTVYELGSSTSPYPSVEDILYLAFYPLTFLGLRRFRVGRVTPAESRKLVVDSALVVVGGGSLIWYVVLGPTAVDAGGSLLQTIFSIAYPVGDLVIVLALSNVLLRRMARSVHAPLTWIALGLLFFVVGDLLYGWASLHAGYGGGDGIDTFWIVAIGLFGIGAAVQPRADRAPDAAPAYDPHRWAWLPYLSVAIVFGLLLATNVGEPLFPGAGLTLAAALAALLVGIRQYMSHRELRQTHRELAQAHDELAALATTDSVTGLANHRALIAAIDRELERSRRFGRPCALVFLDIDHFKTLNDAWGHAAGDAALRELGFVTTDALRSMDTIGRWGGDEFVALLPEADAGAALAAAERVRRAIARHGFASAGGAHLTCSLGV